MVCKLVVAPATIALGTAAVHAGARLACQNRLWCPAALHTRSAQGCPDRTSPTDMTTKRRVGTKRGRRRRFVRWRYLLAVPALLACLLGVSIVGAALTPGNQDFAAKWADWLRAHHAGLVAQRFEELYYSAIAPAKGGRAEEPQQGPRDGCRPDEHYHGPLAGSTSTTSRPSPGGAPITTVPPITTTTATTWAPGPPACTPGGPPFPGW